MTKPTIPMKSIPRSFFISLVPMISPLTALAQTANQTELNISIPTMNVSATAWRASQVMGTTVKNATDETVGEVKDLVLDMKTGEIIAVIVSSGGFLGIADTLSAVPVTSLRYDGTVKAFKTGLTKAQLGKAPQFKTNAWPDYNEATSIEALRSYRDSVGGDVSAPDNTAQNEKEMKRNSMNPTDQGNSDKDVQITKDIRTGIMDKDLSFNAKNIKIITRNERVTLKGVVESAAEHQAILKVAETYTSTANITDDLKVNAK